MDFKLTKIAAALAASALLFGCGGTYDPNAGTGPNPDPDPDPVTGQYVAITDTSADTSGSFKYSIVDGHGFELDTGAVSVDVMYPTNQDQDFSIGVYDESNSTSSMLVDIILKSDGRIVTRQNGSADNTLSVEHTPGETATYAVTWDAATAIYTLSIDGTSILTAQPFNNTDATGAAYFGVKLGSNSKIAAGISTIDNLVIYSDVAMTTEVLNDDFEDYDLDYDLDGEAFYSAVEAVVAGEDDDGGEEPGDGTSYDFEDQTVGTAISDVSGWSSSNIGDQEAGTTSAEIAEDPADAEGKALYIADESSSTKPSAWVAFSEPSAAGSVSLDVYIPEGNAKTTYINVGSGKNNSDRYFELRISGSGNFQYEAGSDDIDLDGDVTIGEWNTVDLSWTDAGIFTVTLNDTVVGDGIDQADTGLDSANTPSQVTLYTGDTSGDANYAYFDNITSSLF
ncbi:hypothetical protein ACVFI8_01090 [Agarivorans sp. MS3-6]